MSHADRPVFSIKGIARDDLTEGIGFRGNIVIPVIIAMGGASTGVMRVRLSSDLSVNWTDSALDSTWVRRFSAS